MWRPFVERTGGLAPDLPGFGKSPKPASGDYTFGALARFVGELTSGLERFSLVVHDWGAVGLLAALDRPDIVDKLVVINAVPFLPGYRWHAVARAWRTPVLGELSMGLSSRGGFRRVLQRQGAAPEVAEQVADAIWPDFDHGTQRAILRLYRSAPESALVEAGRDLGRLAGARALVVWGDDDPYVPAEFARAYADVLGGELELVERGSHWPWLDDPSLVERVGDFLGG